MKINNRWLRIRIEPEPDEIKYVQTELFQRMLYACDDMINAVLARYKNHIYIDINFDAPIIEINFEISDIIFNNNIAMNNLTTVADKIIEYIERCISAIQIVRTSINSAKPVLDLIVKECDKQNDKKSK